MRTLTIGFSTPKKFKVGSWLIKKFEKSGFSHIYIKMDPAPNSKLNFAKIFQASHGDVNAITFDNFKEQNKILHEYKIEVSTETFFNVASWLWFQLGKPYGFMQLITIGLRIRTKANGDRKFICSELAAMVLKDYLGFDVVDKLDYIGLNDIKEILDKELK